MVIVMMWWDGNGWGWGGWFMMAVMMAVFWGLVIAGVVALVRYTGGPHRAGRPDESGVPPGAGRAEDVLAERFARGEIDEDEYRRRLAVLRERR
jgi:putative membrane protein